MAATREDLRVRVRSDRRFHVDAAPATVWAALEGVDRYPGWWPWLRVFRAGGLVSDELWTCVVQPPLPYRLSFRLHLDEVVWGRQVRATLSGDLDGWARLDLEPTPGAAAADAAGIPVGTDIRLRSDLAPTARLPRAVGSILPPVARFGHDWVLDNGIRQFRRALRVSAG
jgi:hypothetical protein